MIFQLVKQMAKDEWDEAILTDKQLETLEKYDDAMNENRATLAQSKRHSIWVNPTVLRLCRGRGMRQAGTMVKALTGCGAYRSKQGKNIYFSRREPTNRLALR